MRARSLSRAKLRFTGKSRSRTAAAAAAFSFTSAPTRRCALKLRGRKKQARGRREERGEQRCVCFLRSLVYIVLLVAGVAMINGVSC